MPSDQWVVLIHSSCLEGSERELWGHFPVCFLGVGRGPVYISILYHLFSLFKPLSAPPTPSNYSCTPLEADGGEAISYQGIRHREVVT